MAEQPDPEKVLKPRDLKANRRKCDAQLCSYLVEAVMRCRSLKGAQRGQWHEIRWYPSHLIQFIYGDKTICVTFG